MRKRLNRRSCSALTNEAREVRTKLGMVSGRLVFNGWDGRITIKERRSKPGEFLVKISLNRGIEELDLYDNRTGVLQKLQAFGKEELSLDVVRPILEGRCRALLFRKIKEGENCGKYFYVALFDCQPGDNVVEPVTPTLFLTRRR